MHAKFKNIYALQTLQYTIFILHNFIIKKQVKWSEVEKELRERKKEGKL